MKPQLLCVDDEIDNVEALERLFRKKFNVLKATSGADALKLLEGEEVHVIISDQRMPEMTGVEFLAQSMRTHPDTIRILLTGYTDVESVIDAINSGEVYRYIAKPWDPVDLMNTVEKAYEKHELRGELKEKNIQLEQALEGLKTLDQSKSQFMILINHELKTPLTSILSYLQILEETNLVDEQKKYIKRISEGSQRLNDLIHDALELVSAETGSLPVTKKKLQAQELFKGFDQEFETEISKKSQSLQVEACKKTFSGDPKILRSVLKRLIDNAIKFGEEGSPVALKAEDEGEKILFSVTNTGQGFDDKTIQKILKPYSLDENVMNHSKGTGMGLSVSQALLKTHDSALEFLSEEGGVRVQFTIDPDGL